MVLTAEGARQIFAQAPTTYDAFWRESFAGMNGEGSLWVLTGEAHRRERRLFAPAVHAGHFRAHGEVIRGIAKQHFSNWRQGEIVRSTEATKAIALDVIMRLVFGVEDDRLMAEGRIVLGRLTSTAHPLIVFYPRLQRRWFPPFQSYLRAKAAMYVWARALMGLRRARGQLGEDVLGRLMTASDEDGQPYSDLHICNELLSILTAGHITTGVALAWTLYELGRHPHAMRALRAELGRSGADPRADVLLAMPYLSAVCNETIRLHPILAECARVPTEPVEILNHMIPAGQPMVMSIVGIHHDPITFPDAERFRPERFLERTYEKTEFMPYGGGHRRCLGAGLAEYTLRIATAEAVMQWEFEAAVADRDIRHDLAMGPKKNAPLRILRRACRPPATEQKRSEAFALAIEGENDD